MRFGFNIGYQSLHYQNVTLQNNQMCLVVLSPNKHVFDLKQLAEQTGVNRWNGERQSDQREKQWRNLKREKWGRKANTESLTRNRVQGTSGNPGPTRGTSATGTPRTSPAGPHRPRCLPPAAEPVSRRTRGSWVGLCSRWSRCGGTAAGNTGRSGGCTPAARGAVRRAGAPGTGGTPGGWTPQKQGPRSETAGSKREVWSKRRRRGPAGSWRLQGRSRWQQSLAQAPGSRQQGGAVVACGDGEIHEEAPQVWGPYVSPVYCGRGWRRRHAPDVCPQHGS